MRKIGNVTAFYSYRDPFSNHYRCEFTVKKVKFNCMEQFLMYTKAMFFGDLMSATKIMATEHPQDQKTLGRDVRPYDDDEWKKMRPRFAFVGMREKYKQNPPLKEFLLKTGQDLLVEASDRDFDWGAGVSEDDPRVTDPSQWLGMNLCGYITMDVRDFLRKEDAKLKSEEMV